jgi:hypothetical protein
MGTEWSGFARLTTASDLVDKLNTHPYLDTSNSRVLHGCGVGVRRSREAFNWSFALAFRGAEHALAEPDRPMRGWAQLGWAF